MFKYLLISLIAIWAFLPLQAVATEPKQSVVTTIRPLAVIAQQLWEDQVTLNVIIAPGADLHHYQLKPSDLKRLEEADKVFWLGAAAEPAMAKVVAQLPAGKAVNVGSNLPWRTEEGHPDEVDPHAWLSLSNAALMAKTMADSLPLSTASWRLARDTQLIALQQTPFLITHEAFGYFIAEYQLRTPLVLSDIHGVQPSLNQLSMLKKHVAEMKVQCAIATPDYNPALLAKVYAESDTVEVIDPLGGNLPLRTDYGVFMEKVARQFVQCLQR